MQSIFGPNAVVVVARILAFCTAIPFHEAAHAFVSDKLGDPTARKLGRLTLNPIKHLDPMGLAAMLLIGVGWAKPVPINPNYYENRKVGMAISSAAGPASNLILAFGTLLLYRLVGLFWYTGVLAPWAGVVLDVLMYLAYINVVLAIFNLLPIPPLDGSRIFLLFLPEQAYFAVQKYERYIMMILLAVIFILPRVTGLDPLGWLFGTLGNWVLGGLYWATGFVDAIAGVFL